MSRRAQGLRAWIWQRISALYMAVVVVVFLVAILSGAAESYRHWHAWVANPFINIVLAMFFLMLFIHAWVGIRDVIMDYVKPMWVRAGTLLVAGLGLGFCLIWSLKSLLLVVIK